METHKVVIVDDDPLSLDNLKVSLEQDDRFSVEGVARNGKQGKKVIAKVQPDLLFLDVEMPDMTGMDLLHELQDTLSWDMSVVFYTAYDKYMLQAIRESAFDYLLKPFEPDALTEILDRYLDRAEACAGHSTAVQNLSAPVNQPFFVFTPTNDMRALRPSEIGFFRYCSDRKQWEVVLHNEPPLALRRGMTAEQIMQHSASFVRIHQAYIVNLDYLMIIKDNRCLLYPPFDHVDELLISKKYKRELQERFCM